MAKGKTSGKLALGTIIGAGVGFLAGILTAPKSGKETRKDIKDAAVKTKTEAERKLKGLHSELTDLIDEGKRKAKDAKAAAKDELNEALGKAHTAKEKTRDILSALHDGDAKDEDLKTAVDDAKKAVDH